MFHFKAPGRPIRTDVLSTFWGGLVRYMEVADDQFAVRQVEVFDDGRVLRYDRSHWCDDFGQLMGLRFSRKPKWTALFAGAEILDPAAFERAWRGALRSPLWEEQVATSRALEWGAVPSWLR